MWGRSWQWSGWGTFRGGGCIQKLPRACPLGTCLIPFEHICTFGSHTVNHLVCGNIHLLFISKPATRSLHQIAFTSCIRRNGQNLFPVDPFCIGQELLDSALSSLSHPRQPWALGHHTAHMQPWELGVCLRDLDSLGWVFNWNLEFFLSLKPAKLCLKLQVKIFLAIWMKPIGQDVP